MKTDTDHPTSQLTDRQGHKELHMTLHLKHLACQMLSSAFIDLSVIGLNRTSYLSVIGLNRASYLYMIGLNRISYLSVIDLNMISFLFVIGLYRFLSCL